MTAEPSAVPPAGLKPIAAAVKSGSSSDIELAWVTGWERDRYLELA